MLQNRPYFLFLTLIFYGGYFTQARSSESTFDEGLKELNNHIRRIHLEKKETRQINKELEEVLQRYTDIRIPLHKGPDDPNYPIKLETKEIDFYLSEDTAGHLNMPQNISFSDFRLDSLETLSNEALFQVLSYFSQVKIKIAVMNQSGKCNTGKKVFFHKIRRSRWSEVTVTGALAIQAGINKKTQLLTRMISLNPDPIMFALEDRADAFLSPDMVSHTITQLLDHVTPHNTSQIASSLESVVQIYIKYWADEYADRLIVCLTDLIVRCSKLMNEASSAFSLKQRGMLLGAILAGSMTHAAHIKSEDEKRLWVVNSISNVAWATTTLIGVAPIAGTLAAGIAGTLSISGVVWAVVYNKIGASNFTPKIKEVEGHIEFAALEIAENCDNPLKVVDILETLAWMRATVHVNGHFD